MPPDMPREQALDRDAINRDKLAMLGQLTAGVAHELNNPVGYIASNLNSLGRYVDRIVSLVDELRAAAGESGATICERHRWSLIAEDLPLLCRETGEGAELLKSLVADLKTLGRTSAARELCDPTACVTSALNVLNHRLKHGFTVRRRFASLPVVRLVRSQLIQAVSNIIHNAIQAMGERGELLVETALSEGTVHIAIENDGPPIPPERHECIFEPAFTTKPTGAGSGLGLAIVRRIMRDHGGEVQLAEGVELGGPRFVLSLPVQDA